MEQLNFNRREAYCYGPAPLLVVLQKQWGPQELEHTQGERETDCVAIIKFKDLSGRRSCTADLSAVQLLCALLQ